MSLTMEKLQGTGLRGVLESSGTVAIRARDNMTARYRLTMKDDGTLQVWIEDKDSKQQWYALHSVFDTVITAYARGIANVLTEYFPQALQGIETGRIGPVRTGDSDGKVE
ncbi:hypothetical protein FI667_g9064, partial [Globisporangium splendens]